MSIRPPLPGTRSVARRVLSSLVTVTTVGVLASAPAVGPEDPGSPRRGHGTALMHRDLGSTDSVPWSGPGASPSVDFSVPGGACSTVFQGADGMPVALCTRYLGTEHGLTPVAPSVVLFDPATARPVASLELRKTGLLGGVYGYLDGEDRLVVAEGHAILRIAHVLEDGRWTLQVEKRTELPDLGTDAAIAGLSPDENGRTWFATEDAVTGYLDDTGADPTVRTVALGTDTPGGETIANGLTPRRDGVSVLTSHGLHDVRADAAGDPTVAWSRTYDRGSARKPGQLSWGSGTTPTFFGTGAERVAIVDNADASPNLLVLDAATGDTVCSLPAFDQAGPGTENSLLADGDSLWIPSTYGYDYPDLAVDGESVPQDADFRGGLTRVDLQKDASGRERCVRQWETDTALDTLPELTREDGTIWALSRGDDDRTVSVVGVDADSGRETSRTPVGILPFDQPMQLTGMIAPDGTLWQATATRMLKVSPAG